MKTHTLPESSNRRGFLKRTVLGAAGALSAPALLRGGEAAGTKLRAGLIGCGWYGMVDVQSALKVGGVEFVALSDVDEEHLEKSAAETEKLQGSRPRTFKDYKALLELRDLDILFIATPPHWHALMFIDALARGLDIYCEKPLAYDIREGRAMVEAARSRGRVVQIGFQRRQSLAFRQAKDYIDTGSAGPIRQVDVQIHYGAGMRDWKPQEPPASLDWDRWCGPAPKLPYSPNIGHFAWRLEAAYGNGHLVDWGIHLIDQARHILGESFPLWVQAAGGNYVFKEEITTPDTLTAHFEFAKCPVVWRHRIWGAAEEDPDFQNGIFFYGGKETVFATDDRWVVIPRDRKAERRVIRPDGDNDMPVKHVRDFLEAVRSRKTPACPIEEGYASTATVQLGMIAYRTGARIEWDATRDQIVGNAEAARRLRREYRAPYVHPSPV